MELYKLLVTIAADNAEANDAIDETGDKVTDAGEKAEKSESKWKSAFSKIGKAAVAVGKVIVTGLAAGVTAIAGLTKAAVEEYANYEQLVGGVETLFKDSSSKVVEYANNAYKTAGMSANDYMETVTSFSASLLQSVGGDTEKAAEIANRAITDMSDNANKMGTDISLIQNAYQGFAKQNYTMLDNLKLGYGGTKEEMERLIADAAKMTDVQKELGITVDSSSMSFENIANAISVVQTGMGITGTTAKEASTTIQGSIASAKAAWSNLLVGLADDTQDFDTLLTNFIDSVGTVADNLIPRIEIVLSSVTKLISGLAPKIVAILPGMVSDIIPELISAATDLINAVVEALPGIINALSEILPLLLEALVSVATALLNALPSLITALTDFLIQNIPAVIAAALQLLMAIVDAIPEVLDALTAALPTIISTISAQLPAIIDAIVVILTEGLPAILDAAIQLLMAIVDAIPVIIQALMPALPKIISAVINALMTMIPQLLKGAVQLFMAIVRAIPKILPALGKAVLGILAAIMKPFAPIGEFFVKIWEGIKNAFSVAFQFLISIVSAAFDLITLPFRAIWENCKDTITEVWDAIKSAVSKAIDGVKTVITTVFTAIKNTISTIINAVKTTVTNVFNAIKTAISTPLNAAKTTVSNIFNTIKTTISNVINGAKNIVSNGLNAIKGFFNKLTLKFPNIKLPHFSITGSFNLSPRSVPKLSIDWYDKAMDNAMLLNSATIFGLNSAGQPMGGGESGQEVVSGSNTLMNMIKSAVQEQNSGIAYYLERLNSMLAEYFPELLTNLEKEIVLDDGTLVGKLAPKIDSALGDRNKLRARGI